MPGSGVAGPGSTADDDVRRQAELRLATLGPPKRSGSTEIEAMQDLVHELSVHQIELEMQNEQLRQTQAALERSHDRYVELFEGAPVGYVTLDMDGFIVDSNRIASELLALVHAATIRRLFANFINADDRAAYFRRQAALFRAEGPQYSELRLARPDGTWVWVGIRMTLVTDEASGAPRCRAALVDIDERVRMQLGVSRLAAIVASSEDAIISRDLSGCVTSWNDAARRLFGYESEKMLGQTLEALVPDERRNEECQLLARLARGETIAHFETERVARGGVRVPVSMSLSPIRSEAGHVIGSALIARDISERLRADRAKDAFIATLAHELRNPLAPIRNALEVMRHADLAQPRMQWCREILERQVGQMTHLLEDLLDISRLTRNKIELRRDRVSLASALEQALESTRPLLESRAHTVALDLTAEPTELFGDLTRLTQVFTNLLNNAAKYTDEGGHIGISLRRESNEAVVTVRDDGIGIERANLPRVFDMFAQLQPAIAHSAGGLGIGLALARGLLGLHGGRIEARSEGPGRGTEFVVRLPLLARTEARAAVDAVRHGPDGLPPHRVLVVDDNVDAAETLATMLELYGQDVRTAFAGHDALAIVEQWQPQAMVLDIGMHEMDGYEVCRRVRDLALEPRPIVIACTGWGQDEDRERSRRAGFDAHLVKPVEPEVILELLAAVAPARTDG